MKKNQELTVITKTYDLIVWTVNHTSRFPRNHRHVLGDRIERHLYDVLETLVEAKYTQDRRHLLDAVNRQLEKIRFLFRLAKDLNDTVVGHRCGTPLWDTVVGRSPDRPTAPTVGLTAVRLSPNCHNAPTADLTNRTQTTSTKP